jgi:putative hydroxymethylpyrimidine transport system ATP-binding protein
MNPAPGIEIDGATLVFAGAAVFSDLSLTLEPGRFSALLGPSGAGKTSLLRAMAGLEVLSAGRVRASDGLALAGRVAWMAQRDLLLPWADVVANVVIGARLRGDRPDRARAVSLLERVGLGAKVRAWPGTLSGGERQRVALARTLYEDKPVVLMDEPFSALDAINRAKLQELAAEVLAGRTVLLITHDPLEACRIGEAVYVLAGRPARLSAPLVLGGAIPRAPDDAGALRAQGQLLRELEAGL